MATSAKSMEKKIASDVSENIKRKLKSVRDKAVKAMTSAIDVHNNISKALTQGNRGLQLGDEGLDNLAEVLRGLHPSSKLSHELRHIQALALKSNAEGNNLITELGQSKTKISLCRNQGFAALANLDSVIKSLGGDVNDLPASSTIASADASLTASDKKSAAEDDIKRKLEAIRDKAIMAMTFAAEISVQVKNAVTLTTEGLHLGDEGLEELKDVLRVLDPTSDLAQELKEIQNQALDCNASGNFVMASIGKCIACASTCRNVGNAAIASLESVIAKLPYLMEAKPSILAFSATAIAAKDAVTPAEPGVEIPVAGSSAGSAAQEIGLGF